MLYGIVWLKLPDVIVTGTAYVPTGTNYGCHHSSN
jgi:hypothetical protein